MAERTPVAGNESPIPEQEPDSDEDDQMEGEETPEELNLNKKAHSMFPG